MKYEKLIKLNLRIHPQLTERWVQERIADDPGILGLGDVILKDKERIQPKAGRLDLLLQDADGNRRYEVEVQLGKTDESHLIRTIEYWDIERRRYPQYEHTAVIVAEEITSRFLNVISLFNGAIPLVAVQMSAFQLGDTVSLAFTTVLDQVSLGLVDEDEEIAEITDRAYWENRGSKATVAMVEEALAIVRKVAPGIELKYNKFYIGLATHGQPNNFVVFRPKRDTLRIELRLSRSDEIKDRIEAAGMDVMDYNIRDGRYRVRVTKSDLQKHAALIEDLCRVAYDESGKNDS